MVTGVVNVSLLLICKTGVHMLSMWGYTLGFLNPLTQLKKMFAKTVAVYYRVSTDKQDFESQRYAIEKWLEDHPVEKVLVFQDFAQSGMKTDRKEYKKLLTMAFRRKIDAIIVYRLDRLSRSATEAIETFLKLDRLGVGIVCINQPILTTLDNPFRMTMLSMFAELAEVERSIMVSRIRDGIRAARLRGVKFGAPPKLSEEKIQRIRELHAQDYTQRKIAKIVKLGVGTVNKALKTRIAHASAEE